MHFGNIVKQYNKFGFLSTTTATLIGTSPFKMDMSEVYDDEPYKPTNSVMTFCCLLYFYYKSIDYLVYIVRAIISALFCSRSGY